MCSAGHKYERAIPPTSPANSQPVQINPGLRVMDTQRKSTRADLHLGLLDQRPGFGIVIHIGGSLQVFAQRNQNGCFPAQRQRLRLRHRRRPP